TFVACADMAVCVAVNTKTARGAMFRTIDQPPAYLIALWPPNTPLLTRHITLLGLSACKFPKVARARSLRPQDRAPISLEARPRRRASIFRNIMSSRCCDCVTVQL